MSRAAAGPDGYWSEEHPPSPTQLSTIATLAVQLLGERPPTSRLEASILISRLHQAVADQPTPTAQDGIPC